MNKLILPFSLSAGLLTSVGVAAVQFDELVQVHKSDGTYLKVSTAQSSTLTSAQKCLLGDKDLMQFSSITSAAANHMKVTLPRTYAGCGLQEGYLYNEHISIESNSLTVFTSTIFKKTTADSSTLPSSDKCDMPIGFYRVLGTAVLNDGHYKVSFANAPSGCGFTDGYVSTVHSVKGTRGLTLRSSAWLKTSTENSANLPDSQKCLVPAGDYVRDGFLGDKDNHYWVKFAQTPPGCSFKEGYIYYFNTTFEEPDTAAGTVNGAYVWPEPNSSLGSAWCACRSSGTSPHIGQDFVKSGAKSAVAVQDGKIISKTFHSACGHIVQLEDNAGGIWRYVHLNSPFYGVGDTVKAGQKLADISAYPKTGCGYGAHLHFERRSAGAFKDSAVGKSCQNGFRTCHYDPIKPWRSASVKSSDEQSFGSKNQSANALLIQMSMPERSIDKVNDKLVVALPKSDKRRPLHRVCKIHPQHYATDSFARIAEFSELEASLLNVQARLVDSSGQQVVDLSAHLLGNEDNLCRAQGDKDCITSWSVLAQKHDGSVVRLFHDAAVGNLPVARLSQEQFCLPEDAGHRLSFLFTLSSGKKIRLDKTLN